MTKIIINCGKRKTNCGKRKQKFRIIPGLSGMRESAEQVAPTPQYRGRLKGKVLLMFEMSDSQQTTLSVTFKDKKGQAAKVDGVPEWLVDNSELLSLTPAADGMSCVVAAVGPLGTANVTMKADADLGAGVTELVGTFEVTITGGNATEAVIMASQATEQP